MGDSWVDIRFRCNTCNGSGTYQGSGTPSQICPECNGDKYVDSRMQVKIKPITDKLDEIWEKVKNLQ